MSPFPTTLLGLVLCLGHMIYMQEGAPPTPSIRADSRSVIPRGQPVTIVCQGPAGADKFRLENMEKVSDYKDQGNISQPESQKTEARFHIPAMSEDTTGHYRCLYHLRGTHTWSNRSEPLELKVTDEDVSTLPSGDPVVTRPTPSTHAKPVSSAGPPREVTLPPTGGGPQTTPTSQNYTVGNCVRISLAGAVLLILVAILAEAGHNQCNPQSRGDTRAEK
ncbi:leukocyte-associated immunoglobulin-like receptor 2 [Saccopteryx leptura]|uniref:leukocyte-associated immunoglobulin-like receptor 2 n=1 Tax=Saccopteryx leptura TaxID=249018 RepID=UPI00339C577F